MGLRASFTRARRPLRRSLRHSHRRDIRLTPTASAQLDRCRDVLVCEQLLRELLDNRPHELLRRPELAHEDRRLEGVQSFPWQAHIQLRCCHVESRF
jgi:hypothetical protein